MQRFWSSERLFFSEKRLEITCGLACVAGVNGEGEGEQERGGKMGSGS